LSLKPAGKEGIETRIERSEYIRKYKRDKNGKSEKKKENEQKFRVTGSSLIQVWCIPGLEDSKPKLIYLNPLLSPAYRA
jgi:hypothetical protein